MATNMSGTVPVEQVTELARRTREQLVANLRQRQQFSVDVSKIWVQALSRIPSQGVPSLAQQPGFSQVAAIMTYPLDVAADVLDAQRDFAVQMAEVLLPAKPA